MKKIIKFSKFFLPAAIISVLIIVSGIITLCTKGINFGIDFKPGLIEEVRVAPPVAEVTYDGSAKIAMELSAGQLDLVISGLGAVNETRSFNFAEYTTVEALANEMNKATTDFIRQRHVVVVIDGFSPGDTRQYALAPTAETGVNVRG